MLLSEAAKDFLLALRVDGRRAKTLSWYDFVLKPFLAQYGHEAIEAITPNMMRTYIAQWMDRSDISPETVKSVKRGLHSFWRWASPEYKLPNPMENISYPGKPKQRDVPMLNIEQLRRLFAAAAESTINPSRDSLIIWLLLDTGIRAEGLCGLKWQHVNIEARTMYVVEKRAKGRIVAFSGGTADLLQEWQLQHGEREHVFYGNKGRALTTSGLYQIVKRNGEAAGLELLGPHALRHNFAMNWMNAGGEIVALKNQMGHTSIETTISFYLRYAPSQLVAAHRSPLELDMIRETKTPTSDAGV